MAQEPSDWHGRVCKILNDWFPEPSVVKGFSRYLEADGFILMHDSEIPHEHEDAESCPMHKKYHQVSIYNNAYFVPGKSKGPVLIMLLQSGEMRFDVFTGGDGHRKLVSVRIHAYSESTLLEFVTKFPIKDPLHFSEHELSEWASSKIAEADAHQVPYYYWKPE